MLNISWHVLCVGRRTWIPKFSYILNFVKWSRLRTLNKKKLHVFTYIKWNISRCCKWNHEFSHRPRGLNTMTSNHCFVAPYNGSSVRWSPRTPQSFLTQLCEHYCKCSNLRSITKPAGSRRMPSWPSVPSWKSSVSGAYEFWYMFLIQNENCRLNIFRRSLLWSILSKYLNGNSTRQYCCVEFLTAIFFFIFHFLHLFDAVTF